jgi:hypothetical protein
MFFKLNNDTMTTEQNEIKSAEWRKKNLSKNSSLANVVCCALCNTELEDYEIATCRQMGATEPEMICETCWNRIQNEGYENVMP